ncbi:hypothetical protein LIER_12496 [Lithospermum erythrorhizon]|uniref:Uncharacterized protein n=1 Tax=Lithospermum erythrorhizon TaxID=34254 RepID=A0AAV3PRY4_LITER
MSQSSENNINNFEVRQRTGPNQEEASTSGGMLVLRAACMVSNQQFLCSMPYSLPPIRLSKPSSFPVKSETSLLSLAQTKCWRVVITRSGSSLMGV